MSTLNLDKKSLLRSLPRRKYITMKEIYGEFNIIRIIDINILFIIYNIFVR